MHERAAIVVAVAWVGVVTAAAVEEWAVVAGEWAEAGVEVVAVAVVAAAAVGAGVKEIRWGKTNETKNEDHNFVKIVDHRVCDR